MAHPKTSPQTGWIRRHDYIFGIATIAGVIGISLLALLFFLVHNWGWWRVKGPVRRSRYVKTWHGWVDRARYEESVRRRKERKEKIKSLFGSRSGSKRMDWVFWDPDGVKQQQYMDRRKGSILDKISKWIRIRRTAAPEPSVELGLQQQRSDLSVHLEDLVRGMTQVDGPPSELLTIKSGRFMTGGIMSSEGTIEDGSTVRRRRGSTAGTGAWHANSSETSRVSSTSQSHGVCGCGCCLPVM